MLSIQQPVRNGPIFCINIQEEAITSHIVLLFEFPIISISNLYKKETKKFTMSKTDYGIIKHIPTKLYGLSWKVEISQKNLASDMSNLENQRANKH